jgi:hypothetical protein
MSKDSKMIQIQVPEGSLIVPEDMQVEWAIKTLTTALKEDEEYYISWKANIAMAFQDEMNREAVKSPKGYQSAAPAMLHRAANDAADNFLKQLMS